MTIICGTDLFAPSLEAADAAAALAASWKVPLRLVYVRESGPPGLPEGDERAHGELLDKQARRLCEKSGVDVTSVVRHGVPDEELCAEAEGETLLVVAALGRRSRSRWRLGSVVERLSRSASAPLLVVREAQVLEAWAREERSLKVVLGLDRGPTSSAALRWLSGLRARGACDVIQAHAYDPSAEAWRLGLSNAADSAGSRSEIERALARDVPAGAGALGGRGSVSFRALPARHPAGALIELAEREGAGLLVVGTHARGRLGRALHGSVSGEILAAATTNVACVPSAPALHGPRAPRAAPVELRHVLAATDLTPLGNRAVAQAYALAPRGAKVTLLHVDPLPGPAFFMGLDAPYALPSTPEERAGERGEILARLQDLVPPDARARGIESALECLEDFEVGRAIVQAAERLGVDLICLGTHGQGPLAAVLGSVSRDVLRRSRRPVLVVPPPAEGREP